MTARYKVYVAEGSKSWIQGCANIGYNAGARNNTTYNSLSSLMEDEIQHSELVRVGLAFNEQMPCGNQGGVGLPVMRLCTKQFQ